MKVTLLSGSSRQNALSLRVAKLLDQKIKETNTNIDVSILDIRDYPLDFVENPWQSREAVPSSHVASWDKMRDADTVILISPEYNGSPSSALKNFLDHFPKFSRTVFGICTYSPGAMGGIRAAQQMQQIICGVFGIPCPQMLLIGGVDKKIDADGNLIDSTFEKSVNGFLSEILWLGKALEDKKVVTK
jgi:NAD(P)H-dependent FMN reductase